MAKAHRVCRRCQYCWKIMLHTDMTVITKNAQGRKKWIEILGEGFAQQMQKRGDKRSYICKAHFAKKSVRGRRSSHAIPSVFLPKEESTSSGSSTGNNLNDEDGFLLISGDMDSVDSSDAMDLGDFEEEDTDEDEEDGEEDLGENEEEDSGDNEGEDSGEDDEALSFYEPSSDSMGDSGEETEGGDVDDFEYVLVELERVLEVLKYCRACRSECVGASMGKPSGYAITITLECSNCFNTWQWSSSRNLDKNRGYCVNRDVAKSSKSLEPKSLDLALTKLQESLKLPDGTERIGIGSITTDRDPSVAKLLAAKYPQIRPFYDGWHFARNVKKSIWKKLNQKQMSPVKTWIRNLNNHLYHSFSSSAGDGKLAVEKFVSFFLHMQGIHDNFTQVNGFKFHLINKCDHGALSNKRSDYVDLKNKKHLNAFNLLWKMVATEKRLKDLEKVSPFHSTSEVESFNSLGTIYHSKSTFFHANFPMKVQLTVLHWNNLKLDWYSGARAIKGLKKSYNKSTKEDVWKYQKTPATQKWRRIILNRVRTH
ncbi:unnamed protein product [Caenorhabditis nigoni]